MTHLNDLQCPLCTTSSPHERTKDKTRSYLQCSHCDLTFVPPHQRLCADDEKSRYDFHQNSLEDDGYVQFLKKLFVPVSNRLAPKSFGLDFGCGPGPTLHLLFEEAGHTMELYDHFYFPNQEVFEKQYDFITASEVVEHLFAPGETIQKIWSCLRPGASLGIMTKFVPPKVDFKSWHYKNDDTHVCFFSTTSFEYLAQQLNAELEFETDVALIKKT